MRGAYRNLPTLRRHQARGMPCDSYCIALNSDLRDKFRVMNSNQPVLSQNLQDVNRVR